MSNSVCMWAAAAALFAATATAGCASPYHDLRPTPLARMASARDASTPSLAEPEQTEPQTLVVVEPEQTEPETLVVIEPEASGAKHQDAVGTVDLRLPAHASVRVAGFTNSGWYPQQIELERAGAAPIVWTGTGTQDNAYIGSDILPATERESVLRVRMLHDPSGNGLVASAMRWVPYAMPGLEGYVVGGQDYGGRPNGPAFWNTTLFVYWAKGY